LDNRTRARWVTETNIAIAFEQLSPPIGGVFFNNVVEAKE